MRINERLSDREASESQIQLFETQIGYSLPRDYRQFLKTDNGGRPERVSIVFETEGGKDESLVSWFYTLEPDGDYGLLENIECYSDRIPPNMIPIACDAFGNQFLMSLGDEKGAIYFWDHERENEDAEENDNVHLIADSFSQFAKMFP
jgi:hypothetical protein